MLRALSPLYGGGFLVAFAQLCAFYYPLALLLHAGVPALLPVKGIQKEARGEGEPLRDALASLGPLAVKALYWTIVEEMHTRGIGKLYGGPITTWGGWAYILVCIVVMDHLHDAWFYWTHRLLHWRPLYRHVHYEHHRSRAPSAFTGYAFHVAEALLVFFNELLLPLAFPIHMGLHRIYHIVTTAIHEAGHAGYEMSPFIPTLEGLAAAALAGPSGWRGLNTVQHHDLHHRFPTRHFSLYFTHWDRLCGTMVAGYDENLFRYFGGAGGEPKAARAAGGRREQGEKQAGEGQLAKEGAAAGGGARRRREAREDGGQPRDQRPVTRARAAAMAAAAVVS